MVEHALSKDQYLDQVVVASLKPFFLCLVAVEGTLTLYRYLSWPPGWARDFTVPTLLISTLALLFLRSSLLFEGRRFRPGAVCGTAAALLLGGGLCLHHALHLEQRLTETIVLVMVGCGAIMLDELWTAFSVLALGALWTGTTLLTEGHLLWRDLPPFVAAAMFAAILLHYRRGVFEKQGSLVENQKKQNELLSQSLSEAHRDQREFESRVARRASARAVTLEQLHREVEERRRLEVLLEDAGEDNPLGRLAGGVAHDFANLLTILKLNLDELKYLIPCPETRAMIDDGLEETDELSLLVEQLLAFSRKQSLSRTVVKADEALQDFAQGLGGLLAENIEIRISLAAGEQSIALDSSLLQQALMNLCLNAAEAMPDGGLLELSSLVDEGQVCFQIRDNGFGMNPTTLQQAREPYFTTKGFHAGRGLGLSVVEGILKQHNGRLELSSTLKRGTVASVWLPIFNRSALAERKVLLVEDEDASRLLASRFLDRCGYEVLQASNSEDAKRLFFSQSSYPGLLVTDMVLPDENGISLAKSLVKVCPQLRVIVTSAHGQAQLEEAGLEADFLSKPYGLTRFRELVEQA